jgi:hypothetical protein
MSTSDNASAHASTDYDAQVETSIPYHTALHREVLRFAKASSSREGEAANIQETIGPHVREPRHRSQRRAGSWFGTGNRSPLHVNAGGSNGAAETTLLPRSKAGNPA